MLSEKFKNHKIILASNSPRRQELLRGLSFEFLIEVKTVNELYSSDLKHSEITEYLATLKSDAFHNVSENTIIITADTIVWLKDKALENLKIEMKQLK